eukprot:332043_1
MDDTKENITYDEEKERTDFSGVWWLEHTDNLDAFMKSEGYGYVLRKLMSLASITCTIKHDLYHNTMEAKAKLPIGCIYENLILDGKTVFETTSPFGDKLSMTAHWNDVNKKEKVIVQIHNLSTNKTIVMDRYMINSNQMCEKMVNASELVMVRTFKRQ